jgi:predicted glycosyltransferase
MSSSVSVSLQRYLKKSVASILIAACAVSTSIIGTNALAQSEASVAVSLLPVASVVVTGSAASTAAGAVLAVPAMVSVAGAVLVVKAIEVTASGTLYVLERASDGAQASVTIAGKTVQGSAVAVGTVVTVSVIGAGVVLSAAGEAIAFIPNELGKALLHNERITF